MPRDPMTIEERLRTALETGEPAKFGEDEEIPNGLLVAVLTGGGKCHPRGLTIERGVVTGALNLKHMTVPCPMKFAGTKLAGGLVLLHANIKASIFVDCNIPGGIYAANCKVGGELVINSCAIGKAVTLEFADIKERLCLTDTVIENPPVGSRPAGKVGVNADGLQVGRNADFRRARISGCLNLMSASIQGDLYLTDLTIGEMEGASLQAQRLQVGKVLFMDEGFFAAGEVDLAFASTHVYVDDRASWPAPGNLKLIGFTYSSFGRLPSVPVGAEARLEWLGRQDEETFDPQPYEQLARVFKDLGRIGDYRDVHIAKEKRRLRDKAKQRARRIAARREGGAPYPVGQWLADWAGLRWGRVLGATAGFGYKPWKVVRYMALVLVAGMLVFQLAHENGVMVPAKERVYLSATYRDENVVPREYPRLRAPLYSADVFFPILDFHQEEYWLPSTTGPKRALGWFVNVYMWIHILLGWFLTAVGVAGVTGLVKKDH